MRRSLSHVGKAAPEVALEARRGLVAVLGRLGEQLHDDPRDRGRDGLDPLVRRRWPPRDMAVDPLHRIGRGERQRAGQHLIERDAERIEIAARIDRAVHPSGLLGRHIGEGAGDGFGRLERLTFPRQPRGDAEAGEPHLAVGAVHQDMRRFDILVDEAAPVGLAQGAGDADREPQKAARLHRRADERRERFAARILEHQHGPAVFAHELHRPRRPGRVQLLFEFVMTGEAVEDGGRRALAGRRHNQHGALFARGGKARRPIQDALAVVPQDVEALVIGAQP